MDYIAVNNYNRLGEIGISRNAIRTIAEKAVGNVPGASLYVPMSKRKAKKKKDTILNEIFAIPSGVKIAIKGDGKALIKMEIEVKEGENASVIARLIQKEVGESIAMMCDAFPYEIAIKIARIVAA